MELLLNLAWLLLALPAWWLWHDCECVGSRRRLTSAQCFLALGCMLVVLFPVVSATDDLHAMRAEGEESPSSRRSIRQASGDKPSAWKWHSQPAVVRTNGALPVIDGIWQASPTFSVAAPLAPAISSTGRSPPAFELS